MVRCLACPTASAWKWVAAMDTTSVLMRSTRYSAATLCSKQYRVEPASLVRILGERGHAYRTARVQFLEGSQRQCDSTCCESDSSCMWPSFVHTWTVNIHTC